MCCGVRTTLPFQVRRPMPPPAALPGNGVPGWAPRSAIFEYTGQTALTLASPITGRVYRFEQPGARLAVDTRDLAWVSFVPRLVRVE